MPTAKKTKTSKTSASPKKVRDRTLATEKYYIPNYPKKLYIYKLAASPFWWARYFVNNNAVRKSTKTESKREAIAFAKTFYETVTYNQRHGITGTLSATSFESCMRDMMKAEEAKLSRGELTKITFDNHNYRFEKSILPFFRNIEVKEIDYFMLEKYLNEISKSDLSSSTISTYLGLIRKVMSYASKRRLIVSIPEFPKVSVKQVPRGWFNTNEYRKIWSAAGRYLGKTIQVRKYMDEDGNKQTQYIDAASKKPKLGDLMRNVDMTMDMRRLIVFMSNSYIRPTDIKFMQHKHVDIVENEYHYLRLRIPPTKGHSDAIVTMPAAIKAYELLVKYHLQEGLIGEEHGEDYVFLPQYKTNRGYALKQLQRQWEVLMWDTGLGTGVAGEERTLYSLRHTAIMYRLIYGVGINTLALARNARTGVDMIDRFYAKPLSGEMNIGMLQSKRKNRKIYDGDDLQIAQAPKLKVVNETAVEPIVDKAPTKLTLVVSAPAKSKKS